MFYLLVISIFAVYFPQCFQFYNYGNDLYSLNLGKWLFISLFFLELNYIDTLKCDCNLIVVHLFTYFNCYFIQYLIIACKHAIIVSHNSVWVACIFKHCILFDLCVCVQGETLIKYYLSILSIYKCVHSLLMLINNYIYTLFSPCTVCIKTTMCRITIMLYFSEFVLVVL